MKERKIRLEKEEGKTWIDGRRQGDERRRNRRVKNRQIKTAYRQRMCRNSVDKKRVICYEQV